MSKLIPGYNTISNARFPIGEGMPEYIIDADGCYVYDQNGKKYIDWTASLGTIIRGYEKVKEGHHCLPMKTNSEEELAELLCDIFPADRVRFFKNGSDATDVAVRLARYFTKRDKMAFCGYHGWHDTFALSYGRHVNYDNHRGITEDCIDVVSPYEIVNWQFDYWNDEDIDFIIENKPACIIIEPMDRRNPQACTKEQLLKIQKLCKDNDIIFILDEILSAFRYGLGGITEQYGLEPDLICLGKAMSNGYPLSALVGKKEVMDKMKDIFVSGTYFTDDLSFKAAINNINILKHFNCLQDARKHGEDLARWIWTLLDKYNLNNIVSIKNKCRNLIWFAFEWTDKKVEHLFIQEVIKNGILFNRDHFAMGLHIAKDVKQTIEVYDKVFKLIAENRDNWDKLITTKLEV